MMLADVNSQGGKRASRKRRGRGRGTGLGKTSGRGHKGAAARSGWKRRYHYEGGQIPMVRHMPKRGFSNYLFEKKFDVVNLGEIERSFEAGETIRLEALVERGLIKPKHGRLKVLGEGELKKKVHIVAHAVSEAALKKIEAAGAVLENIGPPRKKKKPVPRPAAPKPTKGGAEEGEEQAQAKKGAEKQGGGEKKGGGKKGGEGKEKTKGDKPKDSGAEE